MKLKDLEGFGTQYGGALKEGGGSSTLKTGHRHIPCATTTIIRIRIRIRRIRISHGGRKEKWEEEEEEQQQQQQQQQQRLLSLYSYVPTEDSAALCIRQNRTPPQHSFFEICTYPKTKTLKKNIHTHTYSYIHTY